MRKIVSRSMLCLLALGATAQFPAHADPVSARYRQGATHGFMALRTLDGHMVAVGDALQSVHGRLVTAETVFHFRDGSIDDDTAVYTQKGVFRLVSDHHVQRGPSFLTATDTTIDMASGMVESRETGKDGKEKVTTKHMDLPPDLANGIWLTLIENIRPATAKTTLPYIALFGGPRLIHLTVTPMDKTTFRIGGLPRRARHFEAKVDLGGVAGVVAPVIGKQPHPWEFWILENAAAPGFIRSQGQFFEGGPMWQVEQLSPKMQ